MLQIELIPITYLITIRQFWKGLQYLIFVIKKLKEMVILTKFLQSKNGKSI